MGWAIYNYLGNVSYYQMVDMLKIRGKGDKIILQRGCRGRWITSNESYSL